MILESYEYEVKAVIKFTWGEVLQLKNLGLRHYDVRCKRSCWVGGFIYAIENRFHIENAETVTASLTGEELGVLGKIGELEPDSGITSQCLELIRELKAEWQSLNKTER